ncbi:MAG: CHAD domain-containing protein [Acidobacteriaceae bacterium]|nr:CHAD domain-containing protein [Acidobacteriaceae bacterium]
MGKQASLVTQSQDEESIHDFRVAIRRFTQGLLLFPDMLPKRDVTKIRKRLKKLMTLTSEVRNRDIALEHLAESDHESLKSRLRDDRITHARKFAKEINRLVAKDFRSRWRQVLGLEQQ